MQGESLSDPFILVTIIICRADTYRGAPAGLNRSVRKQRRVIIFGKREMGRTSPSFLPAETTSRFMQHLYLNSRIFSRQTLCGAQFWQMRFSAGIE